MPISYEDIDRMTAGELVKFMGSGLPIAQARRVLYAQINVINEFDVTERRKALDIVGKRRAEFKAVIAIANALGVKL